MKSHSRALAAAVAVAVEVVAAAEPRVAERLQPVEEPLQLPAAQHLLLLLR